MTGKTRRARRVRAGNQGQRQDGRYLVAARVESLCEPCGFVVAIGELVVRDDLEQWVHDRCCPDTPLDSPRRPEEQHRE